jgi:hypothetical protein
MRTIWSTASVLKISTSSITHHTAMMAIIMRALLTCRTCRDTCVYT